MKNNPAFLFLCTALLALLLGMFFGILGGVQYIVPSFIKDSVPFSNIRPLHVTSVISWIILAATGGIYYYIKSAGKIAVVHFAVFLLTGIAILYSYFTSRFGGKEYLEFPPFLILPILFGWLLFGIHYFKIAARLKNWPVYYYMWATGIILMLYHLIEAYLWLHPSIGGQFIQSLTIQWKAGGSFVGAWNMLVYGTAIFLMAKIGADESYARSRTAFFFYFLGLTNLMFGWAHHIYIVPSAAWMRGLSYAISMTEWIILFHMIAQWRKELPSAIRSRNISVSILGVTDLWIFLNLVLALLFSIPALNYFTHGTHITVAHSMGTTIGINTTILIASLVHIAREINPLQELRRIRLGFKIFNVSLLFFWLSLLAAGFRKSVWMYGQKGIPFQAMQQSQYWIYVSFLVFGIGIFAGLAMVAVPLWRVFASAFFTYRRPVPIPAAHLEKTRLTKALRPRRGKSFQSEKVE